MCSVLGMHVRQKNPRSRDKNTKLYICNHVTEFDHNIINLLTPCSTVSICILCFWFGSIFLSNTMTSVWRGLTASCCSVASARGLQRLCVLGQGLHGGPFNIWSGSLRRVSSEILLRRRHPTVAPVSWGGHHQWPCRPAQVRVGVTRAKLSCFWF